MKQAMSAAKKYLTTGGAEVCESFVLSDDAQGFLVRDKDSVSAWLVSQAKEIRHPHAIVVNRDWRIFRDKEITNQLKKALSDYCKNNNIKPDNSAIGELSVLFKDKTRAVFAKSWQPVSDANNR